MFVNHIAIAIPHHVSYVMLSTAHGGGGNGGRNQNALGIPAGGGGGTSINTTGDSEHGAFGCNFNSGLASSAEKPHK